MDEQDRKRAERKITWWANHRWLGNHGWEWAMNNDPFIFGHIVEGGVFVYLNEAKTKVAYADVECRVYAKSVSIKVA